MNCFLMHRGGVFDGQKVSQRMLKKNFKQTTIICKALVKGSKEASADILCQNIISLILLLIRNELKITVNNNTNNLTKN